MSGPWEKYQSKPDRMPWERYQPQSLPPINADPTEGMSGLQLGLAGVGKAMTDVGRGVGQLVGLVSRDDIAESRKRDEALMKTTAGTVGNITGNIAMLAPAALIPGAATVAGSSAIGGAYGLLQPSVSTGEAVANVGLGAVGGAAGQKLANTIGAVANRAGSATTQSQQALLNSGQRLGMRVTPGKASGSAALQKVEAAMESNPMTSAGFDSIKETNQRALNRAAAKAIGEKSDELSTPVLARAESRIGAVFDSVKDKTPVQLDPVSVGARLKQISQDSEGMLMGNADLASNGLWRRLDDFVNNKGGATREQLRQLSSNLGKAGKQNMTSPNGDRALGEALFSAQEVVEDAIQSTLSKSQAAAYSTARDQYRNLMNLTARTTTVNPSSGNVSGRNLAGTLMQKDRGGFTMGRNTTDLYDAARFVQAFPEIVGNSGTATRAMGPADYLAGVPGNLLARAYLSRPVAQAAGAGAGAGGTAARIMNNPLSRLLAQPVGTTNALQLGNWLQQ